MEPLLWIWNQVINALKTIFNSILAKLPLNQQGTDMGLTKVSYTMIKDAPINVIDLGADPTGVADSTAAMQAARDLLAAGDTREVVFPAGIYKYSVSPNWAIQGAIIRSQGEVRFRYTGTGNAVILDAGSGTEVIYDVTMGDFIVEAPDTAMNGVYVRSVHHSKLGFNVRGCGTAHSGLWVQFAVCTEFNYVCSVNEDGWYLGAKPDIGVTLDKRNAGETASYCYFPNIIVEGPRIGINLIGTLGNIFVGGTSEACTEYGVYASSGAFNDKFVGSDFEANGTADVYVLGNFLTFTDCDTEKEIAFGSTAFDCKVDGGAHSTVLIDSGAINCAAVNLTYNRLNDGSTFTDDGTLSYVSNVLNKPTNTRYLTGTLTATLGTIAPASTGNLIVTVSGAKLGDCAVGSYSTDCSGLNVSAIITSANTAKVYFFNNTASPITPTSGTCKVIVFRE